MSSPANRCLGGQWNRSGVKTPCGGDGLERGFPFQDLELLHEVVCSQKRLQVALQRLEISLAITLDGGVLERAIHALDLTVGPRMIRACQPMIDAADRTALIKARAAVQRFVRVTRTRGIGELDAIVPPRANL